MHRNVTALIVAGRRVVQPFCARTLRVSLPYKAEPIPDILPPPAAPKGDVVPKHSKKKRSKKFKSTRSDAGGGVESEGASSACQQQERVSDESGFREDNWGKDELAPPQKKRRGARKLRHKKPAASNESSSDRAHHIPYVRRTEGYVSDKEKKCDSVLRDVESPSVHKPIAQLAHGLDRVLFNPGVCWLRDPRSRIYNFTPWLESIPVVTDFAFERVTGFVKSSMDDDLWKIAKQHKRQFAGSTSSLTGLLSHCYFLISSDKGVDTRSLSRAFLNRPTNFTPGQRIPASVVLNYKEGVWLIDSDKTEELAEKNVLTWMGTMLEKFLTVTEAEFKTLLRSAPAVEQDSDTRREAYRYAMSDRFVMRSQLDCVDPRLPGSGVFDIKTRAAVPIRLDILNYEQNSGYLIKSLTGPLESFEREYYDLIRSAFLKYSFQARIGNMDGVLVAYHNTARMFGFQYLPLEEMEDTLYGSQNGTMVFNKCVSLLERILTDVVSIYGERSVKCTFEKQESNRRLNIWIQPIEWDEQVEGKPCPITELNVGSVSYVDGEKIKGGIPVLEGREWVLHWTLTESALDEAEIRRRFKDAHERQFIAFNFPAGIETVEDMEKMWTKINYGGRGIAAAGEEDQRPDHGASNGRSENENGPEGGQEVGTSTSSAPARDSVQAMHDLTSSPPSSSSGSGSDSSYRQSFLPPFVSFREPDQSIKELRRIALQGREQTLREEAEGREKVVWGSVNDWREMRESREEGDAAGSSGGMLPVGDRPESVDVDGVAVGASAVVRDGDGDVSEAVGENGKENGVGDVLVVDSLERDPCLLGPKF